MASRMLLAGRMGLTFSGYHFDPSTRQLFNGAAELHLSPKAFDLLDLLIEHRTRAVAKSEIHDRLWPGTFVTEANLASLVAELRRALQDRPAAPRFVRTVHGFGYAFCGRIDDAPEGAGNPGTNDTRPFGRTCWIVWRGREYPLNEGENVIGRDDDAAVRVDAPSVSRRHACIMVSPEGATLEDLGSKNGTYLRTERIQARVRIADLDELQVGSVRMTLRIVHSSDPTQTVDVPRA